MDQAASLHVLIVEDDSDTRANLRDILELDAHHVEEVGSVGEVRARTSWSTVSAIILDRKLADGTAEELLPELRKRAPDAAVIVVTGYADLQSALAALRQGAADYILKPINPDALRASLRRVAERRALALAKQRSDAAFRTLVEAAPCMIVILRPNHAIAYFSGFGEELTGYQAGELLGKDFFSVFMPDANPQSVADEMSRIAAGVPARGYEEKIRRKDGSHCWTVWNAQALADYEGGPALLAVGQDITQLKLAQDQALQSARLAAIGQMMAGLAHESGNALARSQACLEMLALEVEDRPDATDLITRIQRAQDHLRQLYDEVRGYAAPLKLDRDVWNVDGIWRQAWHNLAMARQGRDAVVAEKNPQLAANLSIDNFRVEQVFRNIFENALAACQGPVRITIACAEAALDDKPAVRISVRDNGPGLNAEQRQRIFEPFYTTKTKGTGLGMAIAKRIVEAHGGRLSVGEGGPGAEIILTLPRNGP
jgi:two-component system, LuxR family, sensor kinase FixL